MLLITADDAGASIEVNEAIRRSCVDGHVNSVAYLVNLPDFEDAVERVAPHAAERSVHLNLVEGRPLDLAPDSPLVDGDGWFRYQASQLLVAYYRSNGARRARICSDIRREAAAQLTRFAATFDGPVAIDSHQHTHMFPFALPQVLAAADELDVPISRLRWPVERVTFKDAATGGGVKAMALAAMAKRGRGHLDSRGLRVTHSFCGVVHTGQMTRPVVDQFLSAIAHLPSSELAEVLLHPGGGHVITSAWARSQALVDFYSSPWRERELHLAMDEGLSRHTK